ncbi:MAG TPA: hypothetical protein QF753_03980 [Victivallales bacterium]|nr:hypothetical protein [Victivallales bacterium]
MRPQKNKLRYERPALRSLEKRHHAACGNGSTPAMNLSCESGGKQNDTCIPGESATWISETINKPVCWNGGMATGHGWDIRYACAIGTYAASPDSADCCQTGGTAVLGYCSTGGSN